MRLSEIRNALAGTGFPVAYRSFDGVVSPPYIAYFESTSDPIASDHKTLARWGTYRVELYTSKKDLAAERAVEVALDGIGAIYDKDEAYISDTKLLEIIYEFEGVET